MKVKVVSPKYDSNKTVTEIELFEDSDDSEDESNLDKNENAPYSK